MDDFRKRNYIFDNEHKPSGGFMDTTNNPFVIGDGEGGEKSMPAPNFDWAAIKAEMWSGQPVQNFGLDEWLQSLQSNEPAPGGYKPIVTNVISK